MALNLSLCRVYLGETTVILFESMSTDLVMVFAMPDFVVFGDTGKIVDRVVLFLLPRECSAVFLSLKLFLLSKLDLLLLLFACLDM